MQDHDPPPPVTTSTASPPQLVPDRSRLEADLRQLVNGLLGLIPYPLLVIAKTPRPLGLGLDLQTSSWELCGRISWELSDRALILIARRLHIEATLIAGVPAAPDPPLAPAEREAFAELLELLKK